MLNTEKALAALDEITSTGEITLERYRAIKELINACDDLNRVFRRNGISALHELERRLFEIDAYKKENSPKSGNDKEMRNE